MPRPIRCLCWLAALLGGGHTLAAPVGVGPFTVEAVGRRVGAGGFPNTSANPFDRTLVTTYRVLHKGVPVVPPGGPRDDGAPWWDACVLSGAPRPALLLMQHGAVLLSEADGQPRAQELAAPGAARTGWQWLDATQGQPGPVTVVALAPRPAAPCELSGGRWLSVYGQAVVDVQTLTVHRYSLHGTAVLEQLQGHHAAGTPMLAFSPGGTQFVVAGARDKPGETDPARRFEHALIAFDFTHQQGTVLPIDLAAWRLPGAQDIDAAFARRALVWQRTADGRERASLQARRPALWLGKVAGREMRSVSFELQPVLPGMGDVLLRFLETDFGASVSATGPAAAQARIGQLTLSLGFLRTQEQRLSLYHAGDWQLQAQAHVLIERIAEQFNARLSAGEHQLLFVQSPGGT